MFDERAQEPSILGQLRKELSRYLMTPTRVANLPNYAPNSATKLSSEAAARAQFMGMTI